MEGSYPSIISETKDTAASANDGAAAEAAGIVAKGNSQAQESKKPRGRPKNAGAKKGRGRPKKVASDEATDQKSAVIEILTESLRKAGEPLASEFPESALQFDLTDGSGTGAGDAIPKVKRSRGRPRKNPGQPATPKAPKSDMPKRGRGRPRKDGSASVGQPKKRPAETSEQETSPKKSKNDEAEESAAAADEGKRTAGRPKKPAATAQAPTNEDSAGGADSPKKKAGRPKKNPSSAQNGSIPKDTASAAGAKKRGRPKGAQAEGNGQASPAKSGRTRGRPKKTAQAVPETGEGEKTDKIQVSFSDSESEESEALGKGVQQGSILSALSAEQQQAAVGTGTGNVQHHPTAREPALINKFDESFDEDSDN